MDESVRITGTLPEFGEETITARHRNGTPVSILLRAASPWVEPSFSGKLHEPRVTPRREVIRAFLTEEKRRQHLAYELACRDRDALVIQHRTNPLSVRHDQVDTACRLVERAKAVEGYLTEALAGFASDNRDMKVTS